MTMIYCRECGKKHSDKAKACPNCGYCENRYDKSIAIYLILCWFLGVFGAHRFYAKKTGSAVAMLILSLTIVGLVVTCVWTLVDLIVGICNIQTPDKIFSKK